ncbi:MAG: BMP family ABC transporter substrate-binding protein, partial [Lachnospiraceae bacterium]|nr:BMP family ABC transporter substrate-binding protein [Lachnospiraceae bacterium]
TEAATEKTTADGTYKAALLVPGTLGDKSFWDSSNSGLTALKEELGEDAFDFKVEQMGGTSADMANYEPTFLDYCDSGEYDVIITGSWQCLDALLTSMELYPDQKFILFDEEFDFEGNGNPENIYNVMFKQNEVSYLVGAIGAKMSESGTLCFLGGMDGKVINDFLVGYIQGAVDTNPDAKVAVSMVGDYEDSAKGKDLSLAMYNAGADYGFNVAGNAGLGLIEAAAETGKMAFGVDSDQAALLPDYAANIPTSALKNVGDALYRAIKMDIDGELAYGTTEYLGFAENGVGLVKDAHYEEMVPEDVRAYVDELEQKISDGEITVYTSSEMTTDEIEALKASVAVQ